MRGCAYYQLERLQRLQLAVTGAGASTREFTDNIIIAMPTACTGNITQNSRKLHAISIDISDELEENIRLR